MSKIGKIVLELVGAAFLVFVGFAVGAWLRAPAVNIEDVISDETAPVETFNVEEIILPASDLVSLKYFYTDADVYEKYKEVFGKRVPFTTDKIFFTYSGTISAGIDMSEVEYEVDYDAQRITLSLPEPKIVAHEFDDQSFQFYDMSNSALTQTNWSDFTDLTAELKKEKETELLANDEFVRQVSANAEEVLRAFLRQSAYTRDYGVSIQHR